MTAPLDLVLSVLVCTIDPASLKLDRSTCVHNCEVVAHAGECAERFREIKLTLPAGVGFGSFPECFRPRVKCGDQSTK